MRDEISLFDPERVEQAGNILTLCLLVVSTLGASGEPHPAQVGSDNRMVVGKLRREWCPHVAGLAITVEQDGRRSLTTDPHMQRRAIRPNVLGLEPVWEWLHACRCSHRNSSMR